MEVTVNSIGPCRKTLDIVVPVEDVNKVWDEMVAQFVKIAKVPGFRPGKAPVNLVLSRYRKDIASEVQERLTGEAYRDAIKDQSLKTVSVIDARINPLKQGEPFTFALDVDVVPEFEMPEYSVELEGYESIVSDSEIQKELDSFNVRNATFDLVTGRPVESGDYVEISFEARVDGVPLEEVEPEAKQLARSKSMLTATDENEILPGLGRGLIGASVGEEVMIGVNFGEDIQLESLQNKDINYLVKVKSIKTRTVPELSDEMAKEAGYDTVEALKTAIHDNIKGNRDGQEKERRRDLIGRYLLDLVDFEVSETERREEAAEVVQSIVRHNLQRGIKEEFLKEKHSEIYETAESQAADNVRLRYILDAIADEKKIVVTDNEVLDYIKRIASYSKSSVDDLYEQARKNGRLERIKTMLRNGKTMDQLLETATVTIVERPVPVAPEDSMDDEEDDDIEEV